MKEEHAGPPNIKTLGELKASGYQPRSIKDEIRANLITHIQSGTPPFKGVWGYENTVIPQMEQALLSRHHINLLGLRGQAKTRMARLMVDLLDPWDQRGVNRNWTPAHMNIMKAAAKDPAVDRIFVTAPAKIEMCRTAGRDRAWLQKIRPLYGHHYHFHVRLKCPSGSRDCETQRPTVADLSKGGDGCDETLMWWVTDYLDPPERPDEPAKPAKRKRGARDYTMADLPRQCARVLASD